MLVTRRIRFTLFFLLLLWLSVSSRLQAEDNNVQVVEVCNGNTVELIAKSNNCTEATITITGVLQNMQTSQPLPCTIDMAGRSQVTLVKFTAANPNALWHYDWHYHWKPGRRLQGKPKPYLYALPYKYNAFKAVQGALGKFSHNPGSQDEEAIDWAMPVGTPVYPARPGVVTALRQDCSQGGPNVKWKTDYNYVFVKHDDGTFGEYAHIKQNGILARLGDRVSPDKPLALSGNTGYSTGPHLHFCVFYTLDGYTRQTLPILFRSQDGEAIQVEQGKTYTSQ